jgi:hypothetical protein
VKKLTKWQRFLNIFRQKEYCLGYSKPPRPFPNKSITYSSDDEIHGTKLGIWANPASKDSSLPKIKLPKRKKKSRKKK